MRGVAVKRKNVGLFEYRPTGEAFCRSVVEDPDGGRLMRQCANARGGGEAKKCRTLRVPTYGARPFVGRWSKTPTAGA